MSETYHHGWVWAYKKLRLYKCSFLKSCFRATLYRAFGDTGQFKNAHTRLKIRLSRKRCKSKQTMGDALWKPLCQSALAIPGRCIYTLIFRQKNLSGQFGLGYKFCSGEGNAMTVSHRSRA